MEEQRRASPSNLVPKPTKKPYINFFQAFRKMYQGPPRKLTEMAKMAGAAWRSMSSEEKGPFVEMAAKAKNVTSRKFGKRYGKVKRLQRRRLYSRSSGSSFY